MSNQQKTIKMVLLDINAWKLKFLNLLIPIAQEDGITLEITSEITPVVNLSEKNLLDFNVILISELIVCNDSKTLKEIISNNKYVLGISDSDSSRGFFKCFGIKVFINTNKHPSSKAWKKIKNLMKIQ